MSDKLHVQTVDAYIWIECNNKGVQLNELNLRHHSLGRVEARQGCERSLSQWPTGAALSALKRVRKGDRAWEAKKAYQKAKGDGSIAIRCRWFSHRRDAHREGRVLDAAREAART